MILIFFILLGVGFGLILSIPLRGMDINTMDEVK